MRVGLKDYEICLLALCINLSCLCVLHSFRLPGVSGLSLSLESTLTLENLINVLADVKNWNAYGLPMYLRIPKSKVIELEKTYPDLIQRQSVIIQLFLEKHPAPSWEIVCFGLYLEEEYEALEMVQNKYFKGIYSIKCVHAW